VRLQGSGTNHAGAKRDAGGAHNSGALEVHENVVLTHCLRRQFDQHRTFNVDTVDLALHGEGGSTVTVVGCLSSPTLTSATLISSAPTTVTAAGLVSLGDINLTGSGTKQATLNYLVPVPSPGTITTKLNSFPATTLLGVLPSRRFTSIASTGTLSLTATPGWRMP